jgi:hypothetical protein
MEIGYLMAMGPELGTAGRDEGGCLAPAATCEWWPETWKRGSDGVSRGPSSGQSTFFLRKGDGDLGP